MPAFLFIAALAAAPAAHAAMPAMHAATPATRVATAAPLITIGNFTFGPMQVIVPVGATVTWVNGDDVPHTVRAVDNAFHSRPMDTDERFSFTFTKPGVYTYFCSLHPQMTGKVIVR